MSWNQSDLSSPRYGYDFVVATTQSSINATLKLFLSNLEEPVVNYCFVTNDNNEQTYIEWDKLMVLTDNLDPFTVPNGLDSTDSRVQKLFSARFTGGFRAQLGLPGGNYTDDIVILGGDTSQVKFNLTCSEFIVMALKSSPFPPIQYKYVSVAQTADAPWTFGSKVDLRLSTVDKSAYDKLPPAVKAAIKNLDGNAFSIQQLLFDLTNASLSTLPTIKGVDPTSPEYAMLVTYFQLAYFTTLSAKGEPILGAMVKPAASTSTLDLTDFDFMTQTYGGTPPPTDPNGLDTLNYLCATDGHTLPPSTRFTWDWLTESESYDHDGIIAINRNTFANWFRTQLIGNARQNCYAPSVSVQYNSKTTDVVYTVGFTRYNEPTDTVIGQTGLKVINYSYSASASDVAGAGGALGKLSVGSNYNMEVDFKATEITVTQHLVISMNLVVLASGSGTKNVVDKTLVDHYSIGIDGNGQLQWKLTSDPPQDNSQTASIDGFSNFFTGYNQLSSEFTSFIQNMANTAIIDIPIAQFQNFIFPGGNSFAFKNAAFSDNQDLVCFITYADPRNQLGARLGKPTPVVYKKPGNHGSLGTQTLAHGGANGHWAGH